ncbi:MAG: T9SS type A sorting domain-containing protein, partial [Bacteroidota bacterium]
IDPANHNNMLIGMGDRDAGDNQSIGIMRSTDQGQTWSLTNLNYNITDFAQIRKIIIDPLQTNIVLASTTTGIYRSTNGGVDWSQTGNGDIRDLEFKPGNSAIVYACSGAEFFLSADSGLTWNSIASGLPTSGIGRMELAVTPADPNKIYLLCADGNNWGYYGLYRSNDGGNNWVLASNAPNLLGWDVAGGDVGGQGWYTLSLAADADSANIIYVGGVNIWRSNDGGSNWTINAHWYGANGTPYVHADIHQLMTAPNGEVFSACDGGFFRTFNHGASWQDYSNGLQISQYYRLGCSATNANIVYCGAQDNGTSKYNAGSWSYVLGGDGMEALVDFTDENIVYGSTQNGGLYKSIDGGANYNDITPAGGGAWVTPYIINPQNHNNLIYGGTEINESFNGGSTWSAFTNGLSGGNNFQSLAICPTAPNILYAATSSKIFRTTDQGFTWTDITNNLPVYAASITHIAVKTNDANKLWVTFSGFSDGNKVFESIDGGVHWENISAGIPNMPVNCIVYENNSPDAIYVGTDLGVYYKENYLSNWVAINNGLPNVIVDELEIQYSSGKLRAATFGRGLWETNLVTPIFYAEDISVNSIAVPVGLICDSTVTPSITIKNYGLNPVTSAIINYQIDNGTVNQVNYSGVLPPLGVQQISMPVLVMNAGFHTYHAFTSLPNNVADDFSANDLKSSDYNSSFKDTIPLVQDFESLNFPPTFWETKNPDGWIGWAQATAIGFDGINTKCAYMDYFDYNAGGQLDNLMSPEINFSQFTQSVTLTFYKAYARYPGYLDSLFINVSTDCGTTWQRVYTRGDSSMITAPDNTNPYSPANSEEWSFETVDLSAFAGQPSALINFVAKDGYGNNLYIDNINLTGQAIVDTTQDTTNNFILNELAMNYSVSCFPNPTTGELTIACQSAQSKTVTLTVTDAIGKILIQSVEYIHKGNSNFNFDLKKYASGLYLINIDDGISKRVMKITKF